MKKVLSTILTAIVWCIIFSSVALANTKVKVFDNSTQREIWGINNTQSAYAEINFTPDFTGRAMVVIGAYGENDKIIGVAIKEQDVTAQTQESITTDAIDTTNADYLKAFAWKEDTLIPITDENYISKTSTSVSKFETVFKNTEKYLYRVGNGNEIKVGNLFKEKEDAIIIPSDVEVTVTAIDGGNVSGDYTANETNWKDGKIKFTGTGIVKVSITDNYYCIETEIYLEVIEAVNATTAVSATGNDVVLLNDASLGKITVSGGHTLYGNGFTLSTTGYITSSKYLTGGYVTLNNGTLDNVSIVAPNYSQQILYTNQISDENDTNTGYDKARNNVYSAVICQGKNKIVNSYISGGRAAVDFSSGDLIIDNSTVKGGAVANIMLGAGNELTLKDAELIQEPILSTDSKKTIMGFSVFHLSDSQAPAIKLQGDYKQYAWVCKDYEQYFDNTYTSALVTTALNQEEYIHKVIDGKDSLNIGFIFLPATYGVTVDAPVITDERTNKDQIPYVMKGISTVGYNAKVFSYVNTAGTDAEYISYPSAYTPSAYTPSKIDFLYNDNYEINKKYNSEEGIRELELSIDLDSEQNNSFTFDFSKLVAQKYGNALNYTIKTKDGETVENNTTITINTAGTKEYIITATDNKIYNEKGELTSQTVQSEYKLNIITTKTDIVAPELVEANYEAGLCVATSKGGTWHGAAPALEGIKIKYWSTVSNGYETISLSDYTPTTTGKLNETNNTCVINNDEFTLTLTGGQVHSSNNVYAMPVVCDGKLYFLPAASNGLVNTGNSARTIPVTYKFEDKVGGSLSFSHTWSIAENQEEEYNYSDFCSGTKTQLTSGGSSGTSCLAAGTMITMADGTKKAVEDIRKGNSVLAVDHTTGEIVERDVIIVVKTKSDFWENTFVFDDGTELVTIIEHGIFDLDLNKYVNIDKDNANEFIGHSFVSIDTEGNIGSKKLVDVVSEYKSDYKYDIVTEGTLSYIAEDTLSVTHVLVDVINTFDFGQNLKYETEKMYEDIEKYGLYSYDEWEEYADISVFEEYNIPIMKVGIEKGLYTKEYIIGLINTFVLDEKVQITE